MKRIITAALCASAVLTLGQASAADPVRSVEGTILVPTVQHEEVGPAPVSRQARCAYTLARDTTGNGADSNGLVGWVVELSEEEANGEHTFALESDAGDPAVIFYSNLATCDSNATTTGDANTEGGEAGDIPFGTTHAIVVVEDEADIAFKFDIFEPEEA